MNVTYNNKVLSAQEREEFRMMSEETIQDFAESIEHYYASSQMLNHHNNIHDKITKTTLDVGLFTSYTFCDCVILLKYFTLSSNSYEKSLFRGKLKVLLNEGFKKLYGFNDKQRKESYYIKLGEIIKHFPGLQFEYDSILTHLKQLSEQSTWWKDERNSEVHLDMNQLYKKRHEEINESKVAMESNQILKLCNQINYLLLLMTGAHVKYMEKHLKMDR